MNILNMTVEQELEMEQWRFKPNHKEKAAYARTSYAERQNATVRALQAVVKPEVSAAHPVAEQWDGLADVLQGMRKTIGEVV